VLALYRRTPPLTINPRKCGSKRSKSMTGVDRKRVRFAVLAG